MRAATGSSCPGAGAVRLPMISDNFQQYPAALQPLGPAAGQPDVSGRRQLAAAGHCRSMPSAGITACNISSTSHDGADAGYADRQPTAPPEPTDARWRPSRSATWTRRPGRRDLSNRATWARARTNRGGARRPQPTTCLRTRRPDGERGPGGAGQGGGGVHYTYQAPTATITIRIGRCDGRDVATPGGRATGPGMRSWQRATITTTCRRTQSQVVNVDQNGTPVGAESSPLHLPGADRDSHHPLRGRGDQWNIATPQQQGDLGPGSTRSAAPQTSAHYVRQGPEPDSERGPEQHAGQGRVVFLTPTRRRWRPSPSASRTKRPAGRGDASPTGRPGPGAQDRGVADYPLNSFGREAATNVGQNGADKAGSSSPTTRRRYDHHHPYVDAATGQDVATPQQQNLGPDAHGSWRRPPTFSPITCRRTENQTVNGPERHADKAEVVLLTYRRRRDHHHSLRGRGDGQDVATPQQQATWALAHEIMAAPANLSPYVPADAQSQTVNVDQNGTRTRRVVFTYYRAPTMTVTIRYVDAATGQDVDASAAGRPGRARGSWPRPRTQPHYVPADAQSQTVNVDRTARRTRRGGVTTPTRRRRPASRSAWTRRPAGT